MTCIYTAHTHTHTHTQTFSIFSRDYSNGAQIINMTFQPLFITLLLAMTSCNGKPNLESCHVSRSHSRPNHRSKHARPESSQKTQIKLQLSLLTVPTISPTFIISSISLTRTSIVCPHSAAPPTLTPPFLKFPLTESTITIKSYLLGYETLQRLSLPRGL